VDRRVERNEHKRIYNSGLAIKLNDRTGDGITDITDDSRRLTKYHNDQRLCECDTTGQRHIVQNTVITEVQREVILKDIPQFDDDVVINSGSYSGRRVEPEHKRIYRQTIWQQAEVIFIM
jgi:hypothetical protein